MNNGKNAPEYSDNAIFIAMRMAAPRARSCRGIFRFVRSDSAAAAALQEAAIPETISGTIQTATRRKLKLFKINDIASPDRNKIADFFRKNASVFGAHDYTVSTVTVRCPRPSICSRSSMERLREKSNCRVPLQWKRYKGRWNMNVRRSPS